MQVELTEHFKDDFKFYKRKKKYLNIEADVAPTIRELEAGNLVGARLDGIDLPEGTAAYKVRIANSSANVGKSNGFRIIYYVVIDEKFISSLSIQRRTIIKFRATNRSNCSFAISLRV